MEPSSPREGATGQDDLRPISPTFVIPLKAGCGSVRYDETEDSTYPEDIGKYVFVQGIDLIVLTTPTQ